MNVRTCTSIKRGNFYDYCLIGNLYTDFATIYHKLEGCPNFYFSSLKTLIRGGKMRKSAGFYQFQVILCG